jgi:hypothetical protein
MLKVDETGLIAVNNKKKGTYRKRQGKRLLARQMAARLLTGRKNQIRNTRMRV